MPNNDDYGFWDADRDWSTDRPRRVEPRRPAQPRPARELSRPNYGTRRLGALGLVGLVAVTVALVIRGTGDNNRISTAQAAAAEVSPAVIALTAPPSTVVAQTQPATAQPNSAQPAAAQPAAAQPAVTQPASTEPAATEPAATEPAATEPATTQPTSTASASTVAKATANAETVSMSRPADAATPVVETKRSCAISYKVRSGDYWILIAKGSGVKLASLLSVNGANVNTPLYPGRTVCLPANATTPTTSKPTPTTTKPTPTTTKPQATANTAPSSTAAPSTTVPPPQNTYTRAQVEQIIRNVWPDELESEALRIAMRESNLIPTVRNYCCFGLFQIYYGANKASLNSWGINSPAQLYDPQINAYAAFAMYLRAGGWGPWAM